MAVLKQRLHRKNNNGTYDTIYLENTSTNVLMNFAQTANPGATLDSYLQSIGLGLTCKIISGSKLDDFKSRTPGFYTGNKITGAPENDTGYFYYIWLKFSDTYGRLFAFKFTNPIIFIRRLTEGSWDDHWVRYAYNPHMNLGSDNFDILDSNTTVKGKLLSTVTGTGKKSIQLRNYMNDDSTNIRTLSIISRDSETHENPERMLFLYDKIGENDSDVYTYRPIIIPTSGGSLKCDNGTSFIDMTKRGTGFYYINDPSDPPDKGTGFYTAMVIGVNSNGDYNHLFVTRTNGTIYHGVVNKGANNITWTQIYPAIATWN